MKVWQKNLILIVLVVLLAALPLWLLPNAEFGGADGQAEEVILELQPDYEPWFEPILEPASGEVESLLFALQAAIGYLQAAGYTWDEATGTFTAAPEGASMT